MPEDEKFMQPVDGIDVVSRHAVAFREFRKPTPTRAEELDGVRKVAEELRTFFVQPETIRQLESVHSVNASSALVQHVLSDEARRLGFQSEPPGLFSTFAARGVRPDFFKPFGRSGILLEVERGKTLDNNMDLLDLWKCHLCPRADYLFLVVPRYRPTLKGARKPMFSRVCARLQPFFEEPNLVNVEAVFLFGY